MIIGITGGSGSGKTSVVAELEKDGFYVIDADKIARECVKAGKPSYYEIKEHFGESVFLKSGELDRKKLGGIVFSDEKELMALNAITHKYIRKEIESEIESHRDSDILIDAAVLKQGGLLDVCDRVILITARKEVRIERIIKRDGLTFEAAKRRVESQESDEEYSEYCDFVADNSGEETIGEVKQKILCFIKSRQKE